MEAAFQSAFASTLLKTMWDPLFNAFVDEIQRIKDMDKELYRVEICRDEAWDLLFKVHPNRRVEAENLAKNCYEADDLLEGIENEIKKLKLPTSTRSNFLNFLKNWTKSLKSHDLHKKMAEAITDLKNHANFSEKIQPPPFGIINKQHKLIGREDDIKCIIKELSCFEEGGYYGVSIVGMRGLGKTALANHILHLPEVRDKFPLILQASMFGKSLCVNDLASSLAVVYDKKKLFENVRTETSITKILNSTQWLIMLDDLVEVSLNNWRNFISAFTLTGRKLLITTLSPRVGKLAWTSVHNLMPLSESHCEDLIRHELTFLPRFTPWPSLAGDLAKKSWGLPLVAIFLAGSLLDIKEASRYVHESPSSWPNFGDEVLPVLRSCPISLDIKYKKCFVYFSLFPHDYQHVKEDLILLWMGERLVQPGASKFDENGYIVFNELVEKSIIQRHSIGNDGLERYKMHKFIHDIAQILGPKIFACMGCTFNLNNCNNFTCHLSLSCIMQAELWVGIRDCLKHLRTLFLMYNSQQIGQIGKLPDDFFKKVCKLRVLHLNNTNITELPISINKLKHLHYLDISYTCIKKLPKNFVKLPTLEILKLKNGLDIPQLPADFSKLSSLAFVDWLQSHIQKMESKLQNVGNLVNLRTLPLYSVGNKEGYRITELKNMNRIEGSIRITGLQHVSDKEAKDDMLSHKSSLQRLEFVWTEDAPNAAEVLTGLKPNDQLTELKIENYSGVEFPQWLTQSVTKLQKLELLGCQSCCNLPAIGQLSDLNVLHLEKMCSLQRLDQNFYGAPINGYKCFPSLESLELNDMAELHDWEGLETNTMPSLRVLKIVKCPKLKRLPSLHQLTSMVELQLKQCESLCSIADLPTSLNALTISNCDLVKNKCQDRGEYWSIIKHISEVFIDGVKMATSEIEHHDTIVKGFRFRSIIDGLTTAFGRL